MKILVLSDTHSYLDNARNVLKRIGDKMDMVFHLGDHDADALELQKEFPGKYRFLPTNVNFDYLPWGTDGFYPISFRIVRFKISDELTETLITNLDRATFPADDLKYLYHLRWGIETSFRQLKYTIGLSLFQSKKVEYITQEIFARLTMYNFCELITSHVVIQKKRRKYVTRQTLPQPYIFADNSSGEQYLHPKSKT